MAHLSLHMSKCHIVGNLMHWQLINNIIIISLILDMFEMHRFLQFGP